MKRIFRCSACGAYTMRADCPNCSSPTVFAKPLKFSPEDRLAPYRRAYKEERLKELGLR